MIDKKPFRVTNEQAKAVIACSDGGIECPSTCPNYGVDDCPIVNVADYMLAADLIDARELIEKQEAMLKEMRNQLSQIRSKFDPSDIECNDAYIHVTNVNEIIAILEKTKDYAE